MAFIMKVGASSCPAPGDEISVFDSGTSNLVLGLIDLDDSPLLNPFVVPQSGFWGFEVPDYRKVDIYWNIPLTPILLLEKAVIRSPRTEFLSSGIAGGQTIIGGTGPNDGLSLKASSNTQDGAIRILSPIVASTGIHGISPSVPSWWWLGSNSSEASKADVTIPGGTRGFGIGLVPGIKVTGNVTGDVAGFYLHPSFSSEGSYTITNAYGLEIQSLNSKDNNVSITNAYGLNVLTPTIGTSKNYAINAGNCLFSSVEMNTVSPLRYGPATSSGAQILHSGTDIQFTRGDNGAYYPIVAGSGKFYSHMTTTQFRLSALNTAPSSASATGTTGEIRITSNYVYVCIATNTWVRAALGTW